MQKTARGFCEFLKDLIYRGNTITGNPVVKSWLINKEKKKKLV